MIINNWSLSTVPFIEERRLPAIATAGSKFPVHLIRRDFPILSERINGKQLVWLDNAATTQKPNCVIERLRDFYRYENSNVHRGAHTLAARATDAYEDARKAAASFLNAKDINEIIFVRGATEAVNLVVQTYGKREIGMGDEVIITHLEHHANIVPWQQLCEETGAFLRVVPVDDTGQVLLEEYEKLFCRRTKFVSLAHVSNALGTIVPVKEMIKIAHDHGVKVFVDGAQAVSHLPVDVKDLDCDFYAFSGHKIYAPTGIGVLYGKEEILKDLPPYQGGGNMIADVTFEKTRYQEAPARFEAGTGSIGDAAALGAALDYVRAIGMEQIARYEHELTEYAMKRLMTVRNLIPVGTAESKTSILSFIIKGIPNETVGKVLNEEGIAVRTGHHCAQPILRRFGLESTVRPSLAFYNTKEEIDQLVSVLSRLSQSQSRA